MDTQVIHHVIRKAIILVVYFVNVESVPPEYCLHPLNRSDCNLKPTPVFSYYKSGSRCEIEYWRGCPTYNKFDNEFACSDMCIFRFGDHPVNESVEQPTPPPDDIIEDIMNDLLQLPEENLTVIDEIVKEIAEEMPSTKKVKQLQATIPDEIESEETTVTEPASTEPATTEPPTTEAPTTEAPTTTKKESDESGHPEEVELP